MSNLIASLFTVSFKEFPVEVIETGKTTTVKYIDGFGIWDVEAKALIAGNDGKIMNLRRKMDAKRIIEGGIYDDAIRYTPTEAQMKEMKINKK